MRAGLELQGGTAAVEARVLRAFRDEMGSVLRRAAGAVHARIGALCDDLIARSPTHASLLQGDLLGELGVPGVGARLDAILAAIRRGVSVVVVPPRVVGVSVEGGMDIGILASDFADVLSLSEASYVSGPSGSTIPWLDWLVAGGGRVIVAGYDVKFGLRGAEKSRSRTGIALMTKGRGWQVPEAHRGTLSDNFLTRAFDVAGVEGELAKILREEVEGRLR